MNWRKINNAIHRDIGYFFAFAILVYAVSGIALNHGEDWNPDFSVKRKEIYMDLPSSKSELTNTVVLAHLKKIDEAEGFLTVDHPSESKIKIYFKNGSILYDLSEQKGVLERVSKRPVFNEINFMHRNPGGIWTWVSDAFAGALILLSITGLFVLAGKKGIKGRGAVISISGAVAILTIIFFII